MNPEYYIKRTFILLFPILGLLLISQGARAQHEGSIKIDSMLNRADSLYDNAREKKALDIYKTILETDSTHYKALWRTSLLLAREGYRQADKKAMKPYYRESLNYAEQVIRHYPDRGHSHFVYAVANGRISDISGNSKRIKLSYVIKKHAEEAAELMPEYAPAWHLLGLWHSKVANTGGGKKLVAGVISKGLPKGASNDKAEEYILKAIELDPEQSIRYRLDLGRHYQRAGDIQKAREALQKVIQENPKTQYDRMNQQQAQDILEEIG